MLTRRDWLRLVGMAGMATIGPFPGGRALLAQQRLPDYPFTLGVASGDPLPDGIVLWTRLAPVPLEGNGGMPMTAVDVGWEVARDAGFAHIVQQGKGRAWPELGHSVHVEIGGLEAGREYWYRFHAGSDTSPVGRTKTAPAVGSSVDRVRFAVCGCSHYEMGYFTAFSRMADEHFDFVFHTGDYIYESPGRDGRVRRHVGPELRSLADYRIRYAQYKTDPGLIAAHAAAPFVVTWDDHELTNDYSGETDNRGTPREIFLLRRAAAYQAYYEAMPLRARSMPSGPHMPLYRRLQFGRLVDLNVLDTRQWRSPEICGGRLRLSCDEARDPKRTILGDEQEQWLFRNLAAATGTWTVLGQQVPTYLYDLTSINPEARLSLDKWDGFAAARQRLYKHFLDAKTPNPVILSGDVHTHFGADLKLDYDDPHSRTVGVELTNTAITSNGDGGDVTPGWETIKRDNPHIKYHNARRGYIACTATPEMLRADFRTVEMVSVPDHAIRTSGSLVVEAGHPGFASL
jgi:alkaline phosphatase D